MKTKHTQYTPEFKAQMIQRVFRADKNITQIAAEHEVNPNQLYRWRDIAIQGLPSLFTANPGEQRSDNSGHEQQLQELYAEIGRLSTELARLRRKLGRE